MSLNLAQGHIVRKQQHQNLNSGVLIPRCLGPPSQLSGPWHTCEFWWNKTQLKLIPEFSTPPLEAVHTERCVPDHYARPLLQRCKKRHKKDMKDLKSIT